MTDALNAVQAAAPAMLDRAAIWDDAIAESLRFGGGRKRSDASTSLRELKASLAGEIVAFHESLVVTPIEKPEVAGRADRHYWRIDIPITLFPKRDQGFHLIECIVRFTPVDAAAGTFRIVEIAPSERSRILASASMGGSLELKTNAQLGVSTPFGDSAPVSEVAGSIYGKVQTTGLEYKAERMCVKTEIVAGTGARWRFDDPHDKFKATAESHQLSVIVEVPNGTYQLNGAGYLEAHSSTDWVTATLGSVWRDFTELVKSYFKRGLPVEAYAEWPNLIPVTT